MENRTDLDLSRARTDTEIRLACTACPEVVTIGDDPARRAVWLREFVTFEGWTETPRGLVCPDCKPAGATMPDATALQFLALGVVGWLLLAVIWMNLAYRDTRKRMTDPEKLAYDEDAEADRIIW